MGGTLYFYGKLAVHSMNSGESGTFEQNKDVFLNAYTFPKLKGIFVKCIFLGEDFGVVLAGF